MRILLAAGISLLALSGPAHAAVLVMDAVSIANEVKAYGIQLEQQALQLKQYAGEQFAWATQAQQYYLQGQQALTEATQLEGFIHAPSLGAAMGLLNQAGLGNSLPASPYAVMGLVNGVRYGGGGIPQIQGVLGTLSGFSSSAYTTNHVYTPTDGSFASKETISNANSIAGYQGAAQASIADYQVHQAAFQALEARLQTATKPKDVQDIQAQIALQQAWFANQTGQQQAISAAYQAQQDAMKQRGHETVVRSYDNFLQAAKTQGDGF